MILLTGKINVLKIDKERLFKGDKGTYLNVVIIPTPNSQYSDYMIKQSTEKDGPDIILGDLKEWDKQDIPKPESNTVPDENLSF